jgi:hypothetical protein
MLPHYWELNEQPGRIEEILRGIANQQARSAVRVAVIRTRLDQAMRDLRTLIDASKKTAEEALRKFGHAGKN